jgi:hypothetical protein
VREGEFDVLVEDILFLIGELGYYEALGDNVQVEEQLFDGDLESVEHLVDAQVVVQLTRGLYVYCPILCLQFVKHLFVFVESYIH